jgi:hypothetical protein
MIDDEEPGFDLFDHGLHAFEAFDSLLEDLLSWFCWWRH